MEIKVAITIRSFGAIQSLTSSLRNIGEVVHINDTGKRLNEPELCNILGDVEGVIAGTEKFSRSVFESAPKLRVISRVGVGLDSIDLNAANEYGVKVINTPKAPAIAVAEHTLALIFTLLKGITVYNKNMRHGDFSVHSGSMLEGRSVGIVGLGRIGSKVAEMLEGLGCNIYFYDPFSPDNFKGRWSRISTLNELLGLVDVVTLHMPSQQNAKPILDEDIFSNCKKGIMIINTARGSLIEEDALIWAIEKGIVGGAGLDVFSTEPYSGKLLDYPQVVTTPHVASNTIESRQEMEKEAIKNLINELRKGK